MSSLTTDSDHVKILSGLRDRLEKRSSRGKWNRDGLCNLRRTPASSHARAVAARSSMIPRRRSSSTIIEARQSLYCVDILCRRE